MSESRGSEPPARPSADESSEQTPTAPAPPFYGPPPGPPEPPLSFEKPADPPSSGYTPPSAPAPPEPPGYQPPLQPPPTGYGGPPPGLYGAPVPPGAYGSPYAGAYPTARTSTKAIVALVTGIASLAACPPVGIVAVVAGMMARREIRESNGAETGDGIAIAGIITGAIGLLCIGAVLFFVLVGALGSTPSPRY